MTMFQWRGCDDDCSDRDIRRITVMELGGWWQWWLQWQGYKEDYNDGIGRMMAMMGMWQWIYCSDKI